LFTEDAGHVAGAATQLEDAFVSSDEPQDICVCAGSFVVQSSRYRKCSEVPGAR
jgi:hypothetical protein